MSFTPQDAAADQVHRTWELVERVLSNRTLLNELGFASREAIDDVVVFFRAGNRLHPTQGFDFLGPNWKELPESTVFRLLDDRDDAVETIVEEFLPLLDAEGYDVACRYAEAASLYQVLYVSRSKEETRHCIQELLDNGLGVREISDNFMERRRNYLVFGYAENISYYYR